ncbi:MAG: TRAP transporter [Betaproteobacteria bacterium RIFCSPLOWO2_12_FULL_63_13]|nr:MAG: TRAP transporter [Betaproteobacteria bacterium RIFCSPLOWO2_12_FULL_63_13]
MRAKLQSWFCRALAIYHLVLVGEVPTWFGVYLPQQSHRAVSLVGALILIFLWMRAAGGHRGAEALAEAAVRVPWYDRLLIASVLVGSGYILFFFDQILAYTENGYIDTKATVLALMLGLPLLEATRRSVGWALPIIILSFVLLAMFQAHLPGLLFGQGYAIDEIAYAAYIGDSGIFGLPLGIAANIAIVFLIFGSLVQRAGAGRWFMDLALALTGWSRGGPAKAAVVASALFGSISGGPSSNAATTGVLTIPMMKAIGYTPAFAAAVEAVASTGGMILPPVMGSMAFIMAEWIDVPYSTIATAALTPAILYYLIVFVSVHLQAAKHGIQAIPRDVIPDFWPVMRAGWYHLIGVAVLVWYLVVKGHPPGLAGIYACIAVIATSFMARDRGHWLTPRRMLAAFEEGIARWVVIAAITAAVGIMIGALELSGVGIKISQFIVELSGGNLYLTLLLVGVVSLIVGMGLDATPAYVTLATLMAPALVRLGVPDVAAHLYVVYWGLASFFTPPTCLAVFVTAGIAGSRIWATGWESVKLGLAAFIVPVAFVLNGGLLLQGNVITIAVAILTACIGACLLAAGVRGYLGGALNALQRLLLGIGALLLIGPGYVPPLIGLTLAAGAMLPAVLARGARARVA